MRDCRADLYEGHGEETFSDSSQDCSADEFNAEEDEYDGPVAPKYYAWQTTFLSYNRLSLTPKRSPKRSVP